MELKTRMLVNALMPISTALESDDDELAGDALPADNKTEAGAGVDAAAASSSRQGPPPAELALGDILQDQRRAGSKPDKDHSNKRSRSPAPRDLSRSSADRKRSRSAAKRRRESPQRRAASPRRRRRNRSESSSPPRRRGRSPGPRRRSRSRSGERSPALWRRDTRPRHWQLAEPLTPSSPAHGPEQPPSERATSSSRRRDRHSGSRDMRDRSPEREPASGVGSTSAPRGRSRGRPEKQARQRAPSPAVYPPPSSTGDGGVPAVPTSPVSPARDAPLAQPPVPSDAEPAGQPGASGAAPAQPLRPGETSQAQPVSVQEVQVEVGSDSQRPTEGQSGKASAVGDPAGPRLAFRWKKLEKEALPPPEVAPVGGISPDAFVQALAAAAAVADPDSAVVAGVVDDPDLAASREAAVMTVAAVEAQADVVTHDEAAAESGAIAVTDVVAEPEALVDFPFNAKRGACRRNVYKHRLPIRHVDGSKHVTCSKTMS